MACWSKLGQFFKLSLQNTYGLMTNTKFTSLKDIVGVSLYT